MRALVLSSMFVLSLGCGDKEPSDDSGGDTAPVEHCPGDADTDNDGVCDAEDCSPEDPYTYPGAREIPYDGKDNDCAGDGDLLDVDGDGYDGPNGVGEDCNDSNPTIYPGAPEICYDGLDQDCAGNEDTNDCDGDGYDGRGEASSDCNDEDPDINPAQEEVWYDGIDGDCSGFLDSDYDADFDGDDHIDHGGTDCDDSDPLTAGGNPELWDGFDRNCDGVTDNLDLGASHGSWYGDRGVNDGFVGMAGGIFQDYDGDGYKSIAMSGYDDENTRAGKVYVVDPGDEDGNPHRVAITTITGSDGEYLGMDMANIGDLDGDGLDELAVGGPLIAGSGKGLVYRGSVIAQGGSIGLGAALTSFGGNTYLGIDVAGVGDVNNDGIPDVAGGTGWLTSTHVVVYSGADVIGGGALSPVSALAQIDAGSSTGGFGGQTTGGLDFDLDGLDDLLIGAATGGSGVTVLASGYDSSQGNLVSTDDLAWLRGRTGNGVGITSGWLDDIDGNGYPEILVRAYSHDGSATLGGRVWVVDADELTGGQDYADDLAFYTINGTVDYGHLATPERGGDFDGDGSEDLPVVHSGDREMAWSLEGDTGVLAKAYVHLSATVVAGGTVDADASAVIISGTNTDELMGYTTIAEDIDGDGLDDLVFGAPASSNTAGSFWLLLSHLDGQ